jgi:predicted acyl esterase
LRRVIAAGAAALLLFSAAPARAESFNTSGDHSHTLSSGPYKPTPWQTANLASRVDGANIHVAWTRPNTAQRVPIILDASPYLGASVEHSETMVPFLRDEFVQHGYAIGGIEVRGTGRSGGCIDMFGARETADIDQAISWIASQPWSNGNVALIGSSYEGSTPYGAASTGNPHLKGIVVMNGIPALHDLMFRNGVAHSANGPAIVATYDAEGQLRYATGEARPNRAGALHCSSMATGVAASYEATATGVKNDPFNYWNQRDYRARILKNYKGAAFVVMGLEDWNVDPHVAIPFAQQMADAGIDVRQLYHDGGHWWPDMAAMGPETMRWDWAQILLEWLDQHLRGGPAPRHGHTAEVQSHDGTWWALNSFPPREARTLDLHLRASSLSTSAGDGGSALLTAQGWNGDRFTDVGGPMTPLPGGNYTAGVQFPSPTIVSGLVKLDATVRTLGPGGDLTAWLYDVAPNGSQTRLTWTQMDLAYADGGTERHPVVPGQPLVAHLTFEPTHFVIAPGHRLRLRVWQYSAAEYAPGVVVTPIQLLFGRGNDSVLRLPILKSAQSFAPPGGATPPRVLVRSYALPRHDTMTFDLRPGEKRAHLTAADAFLPASVSYRVCEDTNGDGKCESVSFGCYTGLVPLSGRGGKLVITVYATSQLAPAGAQGVCNTPTAPTETLRGTMTAELYNS